MTSEREKAVRIVRKTKRAITFLLVIILLAGCGTNAKKNDRVQITLLAKDSWYSNVDYSQSEIINRVFQNSGYDISLKLRNPSSYYDDVRGIILSGNVNADIVQIPDLDTNMDYINSGAFVALDEYLQYMPNFSRYLEENKDIKAALTTDQGHIYYVPQIVLTKSYVPCIMYNKIWLEKLGVDEPETLDEFVKLLRMFKANDMNGNGNTADEIPMSIMESFLPYMFGPAFGLDLVNGFYTDEDNVVHYAYYESEQYKKYLQFLNSLYEEGLLESGYTSLTRDDIAGRCKNDTTGVTFDYSWQMSTLYSIQYDSYNGEEGIFCGAKPLSGEYEGYYIGRSAISGFFGVNSRSKNVVEAVKVLDYLISDECQELYCFGIEGKTYTVDGQGNKKFTEAARDDVYMQQLGINPSCLPSRQSEEATDLLLPAWHSKKDKELQKYVKEGFPFIFATKGESQAIQGYVNYISKYVATQQVAFITGKADFDSFDIYIESLRSMNIEELIAIKQTQYLRYIRR